MNLKEIITIAAVATITAVGLTYAYWAGYLFPEYLTIFHAGSLSVPLDKLSEEFTSAHQRVRIALESSGSVDAVRKITDLHKSCDVLAVADYTLIPELMYPEHAEWTIIFASNEMVIAYTDESSYSAEINPENWFKVLNRSDVIIGRSDPNKDPCGYRALMVFQLAAIYYNNPSINASLWNHAKTTVRPKSVELLAGLESGQIDYAFEYKSVAVQHGLKYVELPDEINLSQWELRDYYAQVNVTIRKGEEKMVIAGAPILYGLTIPKNAAHNELAIDFVQFLLSVKGREIINECGQNVIYPAYTDNVSNIPKPLKEHVVGLPS